MYEDYCGKCEDYANALKWLWRTDAGIYESGADMAGNDVVRIRWRCHGCKGVFTSKDFVPYVGYGPDPTDENFPHDKDCMYLTVKGLIE